MSGGVVGGLRGQRQVAARRPRLRRIGRADVVGLGQNGCGDVGEQIRRGAVGLLDQARLGEVADRDEAAVGGAAQVAGDLGDAAAFVGGGGGAGPRPPPPPLPLPDAGLDAAITLNTIYFLDDLPAACAELARVLRPGGTAVIGIGDPEAMAKMPFTPYGFTLRPVADVIAALSGAGLAVEQRTLPNPPIPYHLLIARRG
ncbi:class I SAM-dependent methyltransferase [Nocardia sp. NPDC058497]|uniref:class I SAM-dependent methyltransferase n=1 Tax=Nocardia sp. NPDC058497 TaxID=3346529 RepID=UPI00364913BB